MKVPAIFTSSTGTRALPSRRNSWCSSSRTTAPRCSYRKSDRRLIVADAVAANLAKASWIRRMFEEGARLKQERGADKVFDFTLGNPEIEPPPAVLAAARRVLDSTDPHLHAYMPNAGHPKV